MMVWTYAYESYAIDPVVVIVVGHCGRVVQLIMSMEG
jgi:hypothetical protein